MRVKGRQGPFRPRTSFQTLEWVWNPLLNLPLPIQNTMLEKEISWKNTTAPNPQAVSYPPPGPIPLHMHSRTHTQLYTHALVCLHTFAYMHTHRRHFYIHALTCTHLYTHAFSLAYTHNTYTQRPCKWRLLPSHSSSVGSCLGGKWDGSEEDPPKPQRLECWGDFPARRCFKASWGIRVGTPKQSPGRAAGWGLLVPLLGLRSLPHHTPSDKTGRSMRSPYPAALPGLHLGTLTLIPARRFETVPCRKASQALHLLR